MTNINPRDELHDAIDQIPVPTAAVNAAIDQGIAAAPVKHRWRARLLVLAAAVLFGGAGLAAGTPIISQAVSNVAWLTAFYLRNGETDNFNTYHIDGVAKNLNKTITSHGITVKLVEAYYSGKTIGITGEITGLNTTDFDPNGEHELEMVTDDTPGKHLFHDMTDFQPIKHGYRFRQTYIVTSKTAPSSITLPFTIKQIGLTVGRWKANLKMSQPTPIVNIINDTTYDFGLKGITITPHSITKYAHGSELAFNIKADHTRYEADSTSIDFIKNSSGQQLITNAGSFGSSDSRNYLSMVRMPKRGEKYLVRCSYFLKGHKRANTVTKKMVIWP